MKKEPKNLLPNDISLKDRYFMGTEFKNAETETIARNIVVVQQKMNPKAWTPFSFDDYKQYCSHDVSDSEEGVLGAMVNGGRPVWNTSAVLSPGYLQKRDEKYEITEKFLNAIAGFQK